MMFTSKGSTVGCTLAIIQDEMQGTFSYLKNETSIFFLMFMIFWGKEKAIAPDSEKRNVVTALGVANMTASQRENVYPQKCSLFHLFKECIN